MHTTRSVPVITATAVGVAIAAAVVQYTVPSAVPALQRLPGAPDLDQWWRLVTPLFVQTLGWYQVVTNLVTLAVVGVVAEWRLGRWRWTVLFLAGTVGGQIDAYVRHEPGGGDSIAICGLAGGLVIWSLAGDTGRWAVAVVTCYVAAITGWDLFGIRAAAVFVAVACVALWAVPARVVLLGAVACAVVLAAQADLHGVSLVSGMAAGSVLTGLRRSTRPSSPWLSPTPARTVVERSRPR